MTDRAATRPFAPSGPRPMSAARLAPAVVAPVALLFAGLTTTAPTATAEAGTAYSRYAAYYASLGYAKAVEAYNGHRTLETEQAVYFGDYAQRWAYYADVLGWKYSGYALDHARKAAGWSKKYCDRYYYTPSARGARQAYRHFSDAAYYATFYYLYEL